MKIRLRKFPYKYMEYEKRMMYKEIEMMIPEASIVRETKDEIIVDTSKNVSEENIKRIALFKEYIIDENEWVMTLQGEFENEENGSGNRQHTRYSTHGLHEYKGKYNPQIVRIMLNILELNEKQVLDPFDGSGTSILECAHVGTTCVGTDINPLACYIANTKVKSIAIDVASARIALSDIVNHVMEDGIAFLDDDRTKYLRHWIPEKNLIVFECIRQRIAALNCDDGVKDLMLIIASDLIRDYSNQEPSDLRIRKRKSPFPEKRLIDAFSEYVMRILDKIEYIQSRIGVINSANYAICCDIKSTTNPLGKHLFDGAITSPPYVTALPYIDTQRISLVWLGLCPAKEIMALEGTLIGSREFKNQDKNMWETALENNTNQLPEAVYNLIIDMKTSLSEKDGFRKRAVPPLTYRYFSEMKSMFINVRKMMKKNAPYALIVGHNKSTLGGKVFRIDTPKMLAEIAVACGWRLEEIIPLETYKRYGINSKNAINNESMIILRK